MTLSPGPYPMRLAVPPSDLLKNRLDRFTRALRGVAKGDVKALHRARVASRRLRELVPVLQLPPGVAKKLNRRLRKVTSRLGSVRELDVMLLLIDELHVSRPHHDQALTRVRVAVAKDREAARKRLAGHLPVDDLRRVARKLDRACADLHEAEQAHAAARSPGRAKVTTWAIEARAAKRGARLASAMTDAGAVYLPGRLHTVRLAIKKLRYVLEVSAELAGEKTTVPLRGLRHAQELLGRMHDLEMLIDRVREMQPELAPLSLTAWRELDALVATLEDMCRRLHARYVRERGPLETLAARLSAQAPPASARPHRRAG